jgi:hypothetical protein
VDAWKNERKFKGIYLQKHFEFLSPWGLIFDTTFCHISFARQKFWSWEY